MSIGQIQFDPVWPTDQPAPYQAKAPASQVPPGSSLGNGPEAETGATQSVAEPDLAPTEEVEMQRDPPTGEPVYQFIDRRSGSLILQIPSEQMLNFIREVQQQWQQLTSKSAGKSTGE
jgi:hypothetical protein